MKTVLLSLILFVFADPVLASQVNSPSECMQMYRHYLNDVHTSRSQIRNYLEHCMPAEKHVIDDEPLFQKLLQIVNQQRKIITVRA